MADLLNRMAAFSANPVTQDLVDIGIDVTKHYLFDNHNKNGEFGRYANFEVEDNKGKKLTYTDKNRKFNKLLWDESCRMANITEEQRKIYSPAQCLQFDAFRTHYFSIIGIVIDNLMATEEVQNYLAYAEVINVAWGDTPTFHVGSRGAYSVAKIANGKNRASLDEMFNEDITLTPVAHQANCSVDFYKLMRGEINWGAEIAKVMKAFLIDMSQTAANTMFGAFSSLATPFKKNAYTQSDFTEMDERVSAANGATGSIVYGAKTALGKIIPANQYFAMQAGSEYLGVGYIQAPFGASIVMLPQAVKPASDFDFVLPTNKLLFLPNMGDKPVKVAIEGQTRINQADENQNAGKVRGYFATMNYDIAIATGTIYGIMQVD